MHRFRRLFCLLIATISFHQTLADRWVYTSSSQSPQLIRYRMNVESGALVDKTSIAMPDAPRAMATDADHKTLYIAFRAKKSIGAFRIRTDGGLDPLGLVEVGALASYLAVDRRSKALFSAYYQTGRVMVHRLQPNLAIDPENVQVIPTAERAHAVQVDRSNKFVYVPHTRPESIFGFRFDQKDSHLTPLDPPITKTPEGYGPRHLQFHPNGKWLFVDNEQGDSLSSYQINQKTGALKVIQTLSTLPDDWAEGRNSTSDFQITGNGRFAYVANRGHNSVAMIAINPENARMTSLGQHPIGAVVRSLAITPDDRFLLVAGQSNGVLSVHSIDTKTGLLKLVKNHEAAPALWWVLTVPASDK